VLLGDSTFKGGEKVSVYSVLIRLEPPYDGE